MKRCWLAVSLALCALPVAAKHDDAGLVVHEWGTFLAMAGSDGVTLDGMYHEEHALPPFVHARGKDQLRMRSVSLKGETPVIYFYTDRAQDVNVRVNFPNGIWTQWYPQATLVAPGLSATQADRPKNGHICWNVKVLPTGKTSPDLPATHTDALWNFARQVDAAFVRSPDRETERFIFYRGLGRANLPLQVSAANGGTLKLGALPGAGLKHLFVIRVEGGMANYRYVPALSSGETLHDVIPAMQGATGISTFSRRIGADLADRLVASGLFRKEAEAMANTWRKSYFESDGVRVLFVLPQEWTEGFIPMSVYPKPTGLVRVMVGRTELLTPEREARAETAVKELVSADRNVRERAFAYLRSQGRYVEPVVNRVLRSAKDEKVRASCRSLLMSEFVTDLRSAMHSAANGSGKDERPGEVRAALSVLLRQIGQEEQAADEAQAAKKELAQLAEPALSSSDSRWYLRAYARMNEGLGNDRGAAAYYEKLVRFGSQTTRCGGCHEAAGPRNMTFYRDWWAGQKYAEYIERMGIRDSTIRAHKETLARNPSDTATQMMLAYLSGSKGDTGAALQLWAAIEGRPGQVAIKEASVRSR